MDMNPFDALGSQVAKSLDAVSDPGPDERLRGELAKRAALHRSPARSWTRLAPAAAALVLTAAAALALVVLRPAPAAAPELVFEVGAPARPGVLREWMSASETNALPLEFSDGSRVVLQPKTRARVVRLAQHGAELVLESGKANVVVVPNSQNQWRIRSGPFVVDVRGTRFDVAWDPSADEFEVVLYEGRVQVAGCGLGGGRQLTAGQRVRASCKAAVAAVSSPSAMAPAPPMVAPAARAPIVSESLVPKPIERSAGTNDGALDWVALARKGFHERAFALAESRGFDHERRNRSPNELLLLAECARLTGHEREAREVYEELRRRDGAGTAASQAAFELGRMDAARSNQQSAAAWFETYLREQPRGALAAAARGRLLECQVALGDTARAKATARSYLEQAASGPHADAARRVLGLPAAAPPPR